MDTDRLLDNDRNAITRRIHAIGLDIIDTQEEQLELDFTRFGIEIVPSKRLP